MTYSGINDSQNEWCISLLLCIRGISQMYLRLRKCKRNRTYFKIYLTQVIKFDVTNQNYACTARTQSTA